MDTSMSRNRGKCSFTCDQGFRIEATGDHGGDGRFCVTRANPVLSDGWTL
jgi:hypothetical protein